MKEVHIHSSKDYRIIIDKGILKNCGQLIKEVSSARKTVVVSDDNVYGLYGDVVRESLEQAGFETDAFVFPNGEQSKNLTTYSKLLEFMCDRKMSRTDLVVSLGGGVPGDLAGFAAATFQRGIDFVQIPTTLLACVDSSVGGKTGVDLTNGKNQVGAFHQPVLVIADYDTLSTLPKEQYACGAAEVIKYAMIGDEAFARELLDAPIDEQYENVIYKCVSMKKEYVEKDEFDTGLRMMLNFGHTIGHGIETASSYRIMHGQAVAMGMDIITKASLQRDICDGKTYETLLSLLDKYELKNSVEFDADTLYEIMQTDKKNTGDKTRLIVPISVGKCEIKTILTTELTKWMKDGGIK